MTKFESVHMFDVSPTETLAVNHGLLVALFAMSYLRDESGYHTHKVTAIKLLRKYVQMQGRDLGLLEAKGVIEMIWENFTVDSLEVAYQKESFSVTYRGVDK